LQKSDLVANALRQERWVVDDLNLLYAIVSAIRKEKGEKKRKLLLRNAYSVKNGLVRNLNKRFASLVKDDSITKLSQFSSETLEYSKRLLNCSGAIRDEPVEEGAAEGSTDDSEEESVTPPPAPATTSKGADGQAVEPKPLPKKKRGIFGKGRG